MVLTDALSRINLLRCCSCQKVFFFFFFFVSSWMRSTALSKKKKIRETPEGKRNATRRQDENWVPLVNRGDDLTQSACIELHTVS